MFKEIPENDVLKLKGEKNCRWFRDGYFDLFVWHDETGARVSFQLCYDIYGRQRAVTWHRDHGYSHHAVDDGARPGKPKASPLMVGDSEFDVKEVADKFKDTADKSGMERDLAAFVFERIMAYKIKTK
jgi:hypothetical protein